MAGLMKMLDEQSIRMKLEQEEQEKSLKRVVGELIDVKKQLSKLNEAQEEEKKTFCWFHVNSVTGFL